jgi:hypothetical protein
MIRLPGGLPCIRRLFMQQVRFAPLVLQKSKIEKRQNLANVGFQRLYRSDAQ